MILKSRFGIMFLIRVNQMHPGLISRLTSVHFWYLKMSLPSVKLAFVYNMAHLSHIPELMKVLVNS